MPRSPDIPTNPVRRWDYVGVKSDGSFSPPARVDASQPGKYRVERPVDGHAGWWAVGIFADVRDQLELVGLELFHEAGSVEPLPAALLRDVRIHDLKAPLVVEDPKAFGLMHRFVLTKMKDEEFATRVARLGELSRQPRRRRDGRSDGVYAQWALMYEQVAMRSGRPIEELAKQSKLSRKSVANLIDEARRRDLLTKPGQGRAGGRCTPKARAVLEGQTDASK